MNTELEGKTVERILKWFSGRKGTEATVRRVMIPKEITLEDQNLPVELRTLLVKWRKEADVVRGKAEWYAKLAKYYFTFKGVEYVLTPKPFNLSDADFEIMKIEDDLKGIGCVDILYTGMLD